MTKRSSLTRAAAPAAVLLAGAYAAITPSVSDAAVRVAPAPQGEPISSRFTVTVDNQNAPVYTAHVLCISKVGSSASPEERLDGEAGFASFDMSAGGALVKVVCAEPVQAAKILPTSYGIVPTFHGNEVTFRVAKPGQITLEVNGDWNNSLHVFANPMETEIPRPTDPNVIYFGPGVHQTETVHVTSGQTVYIAPGAVIYGIPSTVNHGGPIFSLDGSNIVLRGRGIINGGLILEAEPGRQHYRRSRQRYPGRRHHDARFRFVELPDPELAACQCR